MIWIWPPVPNVMGSEKLSWFSPNALPARGRAQAGTVLVPPSSFGRPNSFSRAFFFFIAVFLPIFPLKNTSCLVFPLTSSFFRTPHSLKMFPLMTSTSTCPFQIRIWCLFQHLHVCCTPRETWISKLRCHLVQKLSVNYHSFSLSPTLHHLHKLMNIFSV